ncbi:hypothetical protein [Actinoplanes sp. NPDC026623]|uniref:hypothetical protein n=1 Tax=Actinoplanes sp. NPDC026623 TaxID=3155610 RepID=UPI0033F87F67
MSDAVPTASCRALVGAARRPVEVRRRVLGRNEVSLLQWLEAFDDILSRSHLWPPDDLARAVDAAVARLGMRATIWLVDYEQLALRPLPVTGRATPEPLPVDCSLPGRAFARVESIPGTPDGDNRRWWVPMVDGTDRLGALEVVFPSGEAAESGGAGRGDAVRRLELLAGLVGHLIATTSERGGPLREGTAIPADVHSGRAVVAAASAADLQLRSRGGQRDPAALLRGGR